MCHEKHSVQGPSLCEQESFYSASVSQWNHGDTDTEKLAERTIVTEMVSGRIQLCKEKMMFFFMQALSHLLFSLFAGHICGLCCNHYKYSMAVK